MALLSSGTCQPKCRHCDHLRRPESRPWRASQFLLCLQFNRIARAGQVRGTYSYSDLGHGMVNHLFESVSVGI